MWRKENRCVGTQRPELLACDFELIADVFLNNFNPNHYGNFDFYNIIESFCLCAFHFVIPGQYNGHVVHVCSRVSGIFRRIISL